MNLFDLANNLKATVAWAGATIATNTDTDGGSIIDTQGFEAVAFEVHVGAITDGTYVLKIMESSTSDFSTDTPTEVPAYQIAAAARTFTKSPTDDSNKVKKVGAKMTKRYAKVRITSTGTTTGAVFKSGVALLAGAHEAPVA